VNEYHDIELQAIDRLLVPDQTAEPSRRTLRARTGTTSSVNPSSRGGFRGAELATYRDDPLYPRIVRAVAAILANGMVVAPVDPLMEMGLLTEEKLEDWRRGRVPCLEKVVACILTRLPRLAHDRASEIAPAR